MARYLVTSALPYANGPIHFGHVAGAYLPADVFVRTLRMQGEDVVYVCGTDDYGLAITVAAEKAGRDFGEYVAQWNAEIKGTFDRLDIQFDIFSGTSRCPVHVDMTQQFFRYLGDNGYLERHESDQFYCSVDALFLADRYLSGTCYECGHENARGDECPACGTWIDALRLESPTCRICGGAPEVRSTRHWYLDLPSLRHDFLADWVSKQSWKPNVGEFVTNMLDEVPQRAITRDMSWGVPLPEDRADGETGKVLYVWFDAPIGYISFTREYFESRGEPEAWRDYWQNEDTRLVHFIGKDNIPFHCIVFPGMLYGAKRDWVFPAAVPANEFYRLEGEKFSTSEGHTFDTEAFFEEYDRDVTRFHILWTAPETSDSDFRIQQLVEVNNGILADTIGNLATRVLRFAARNFEGRLPSLSPEHEAELDVLLLEQCGAIADPAAEIHRYRFRAAAQQLIANARAANEFLEKAAPWQLRKTDPEKAASVLATAADWLGLLSRWMAPMMPGKAQALWEMLGQDGAVTDRGWPERPTPGNWRALEPERPLPEIVPLFPKIETE